MDEWGELEMIWMLETEAARVRRQSRSHGSLATLRIVAVTMAGLGAASSLSYDRPHTSSLECREQLVTLQSSHLCNTQPG